MNYLTKKQKENIKTAGYNSRDAFSGIEIYKTLADNISFTDLQNEINKLANFLYPSFTVNNVKNEIRISQAFNQIKISHQIKPL